MRCCATWAGRPPSGTSSCVKPGTRSLAGVLLSAPTTQHSSSQPPTGSFSADRRVACTQSGTTMF